MAGLQTLSRGSGPRCRLPLLWALGLLLGSPSWPAGAPVAWTSLDRPIQQTLAKGETAAYAIELAAGQCLRVVVDQEGIDTQEVLRAPSGKVLLKLDTPTGRFGSEAFSVIATESGLHTLEIQALDSAGQGAYFRLEAVRRVATPEDQRAAEADRDFATAYELEDSRRPEDLARAASLYRAVLTQRQSLGDPAGTAWALQRLGLLQLLQGDPAPALRSLEESLRRFRDLGDRRGAALTLHQMAGARQSLGDAAGALAALQEVLGIWRDLGEEDHQASALLRLGQILLSQGRAQEALDSHRQSLALFRELGDRRQEATVLTYLGGTLEALSRPLEARQQYEAALAIAREIGAPGIQAASLNGLGTLFSRLGQPGDALSSFTAALGLFRQAGNPAAQAVALQNIGSLLVQLGSPEAAREVLLEALPLHRDPRHEALTRMTLGRIATDLGRFDEARELLAGALALQRKLHDRAGEASTLDAEALLGLQQGDARSARQAAEDSLAIARDLGSSAREAEARALLGRAFAALGDVEAAQRSWSAALATAEALGRVDGQAQILTERARLERDRDPEAARRDVEAAIERYESFRSALSGERLRISQSASLREVFDLYVDVLMLLDRRRPGKGMDGLALAAAEKARARGLLDRLAQQVEVREGDPELLAREASLRYQLNSLAERRFRLSPDQDAEELAEVRKKIDALSAEYPIVDAQIQARSPRYAALKRSGLQVAEIQALLGDGTVLLEFSLGEPRSHLWLVTPDAVSSFELPGRGTIEALARRVHERLRSPGGQGGAGERDDLVELSRILLGPVLGPVEGRRLIVVPDGALQYVPFAALPVPAAGAHAEVPLIVQHEVVTLPSAAVLREIRRVEASRGPAPAALAILADPVYEMDDPRVRAASGSPKPAGMAKPSAPPDRVAGVVRSVREPNAGGRLSRLSWSRREAEGIAAEAKGRDVLLALDFQANRDLATGPDLARYRRLHLATHGFLDAEHPDLSALALSQVDEAGRSRDGFLRLQDVYHLHLNADLVVLSGCETALGKNLRGEGIVGLTHGFFHAGASQVLASLWPVRDRATAELMQRFYHGLFHDGLPASAALRQAQISLWKERAWRDPYFWAAFVLQGDWQAGGR
ncbi:MAG TPA: CHAT domain-containing protein [Thermoanaerobaculia bacterium]|jgi:CHAT domain-containing protein/tetratricopeptide (TPR) repeat protein|nr:CHAT domain-containing protein [Thermoanaerobaculia bacterium]